MLRNETLRLSILDAGSKSVTDQKLPRVEWGWGSRVWDRKGAGRGAGARSQWEGSWNLPLGAVGALGPLKTMVLSFLFSNSRLIELGVRSSLIII